MDALSVLQFFGISLIPFAVALFVHLVFKFTNPLMVRKPEFLLPIKRKWLYKHVKYPFRYFLYIVFSTKKGAYWWRMTVLGVFFASVAIAGYFFGVQLPIKGDTLRRVAGIDYFIVGNTTVAPVIAGLVFGWPAGIISGTISFIFRICMPGFLRWPTSVALLISGGVSSAVSHFIFKDKRPKWYFGILIAVFVETFNIFLIYLFYLEYITDVYMTVSTFDIACIGFAALSVALTNVTIALIEKEKMFPKLKETNNISFHVELALVIACVIGMGVMTASVRTISETKSVQDYNKIATETNDDAKGEISALVKNLPSIEDITKRKLAATNILYAIPDQHHVATNGFLITVCGPVASEGALLPVYGQSEGPDLVYYTTNDIISVPSHSGYSEWEGPQGTDKGFYWNWSPNDKNWHSLKEVEEGKPYYIYIIGKRFLMMFRENELSIGGRAYAYSVVLISSDEIESASGTVFRISLYTNILVIIALFTFAEYFVNQKIVRRVETMDKALEDIMDGNLDREIHVEGYNEFSNLSNNINLTVGALKNYAHEVELRIENELQFARDIQTTSVPTSFPFEKNYNIYAKMEPAKEVSGDFYDYFKMNNGRILFLIADVSGKGIPAAMFMMRARTLIKSLSSTDIPLEEIVNKANKDLCTQNEAALFVTAWIGILNSNNGELRYINAGHLNPLLKKKNGKFEEFKNYHNFVLAADPDYKFKSEITYLEPGDEIVLYTDGVTEAHNPNKELYGTKRLIELVNKAQYFNAKQLLDEISDDVVKYADGEEQFDDTTLLILRYLGNSNITPETEITLKARPTNAVLAVNFVESVLAKYELPPTFIARVSIVVDELFANIAFYAYPEGHVGEAKIQVDFRDNAFYLTLIDSGIPFDPTVPREVDTTSSIDERKRGGLGIFIVKKTMDELKYEYRDNKNILNLVKHLDNISQDSNKPKEINKDPDALEKALASLPDDDK